MPCLHHQTRHGPDVPATFCRRHRSLNFENVPSLAKYDKHTSWCAELYPLALTPCDGKYPNLVTMTTEPHYGSLLRISHVINLNQEVFVIEHLAHSGWENVILGYWVNHF